MVVEVRERLAVIKQRSHMFHMERFNMKSNKVERKEQYRVGVSNRFAALKDLDVDVDINSVWWRNQKERDHWEVLDVGWWIILK
jgi:hypothetical protein